MNIIELPKGGIIIDTKIGAIQLGAPPETIKDSLSLNREVLTLYIAPKHLFSYKRMASLIDIEFPVYYNFFILKKRITIFCTENQKNIISDFFKESLFGPKNLNLEIEYINGSKNYFFPDLRKEMNFFSKHPSEDRSITLDDMIEFFILKENKEVVYKNLKIKLDTINDKIYLDDGEDEKVVLWDIDFPDIELKEVNTSNIFIPPIFGITTLGSSHGFDPKGKTSGFIFWINGSGIMIDPPIDSALWLIEENVDPRMVSSVILTHCHSDHDAGVMQKVLQEGRITLYTTPTIFTSFIKKVSLLTGLSDIDVVELIEFVPVTIGKPININGAMLTFSYRLHSIPTIGFEVFFKGKTVVYTSDHLNDKKFFDELYSKGVLTQGRYEELVNFSWNKDVIIHEAGIPPLHTSLDVLLALPKEVKKNIYLVHTDKSKIPPDSEITISPTGLSNTMTFEISASVHSESVQILNLVAGLDIFEDIKFFKAAEFLSIIKYRKFKKDECLVKEGDINNRFYILIAGRAKLIENGYEKAILTSGSYFGETAIILNQPASGTLIAMTDLITIVIDKEDFLMFLSNTPTFEKLKKLGEVRSYGSWDVIELNSVFKTMTINQKNHLELIMSNEEAYHNDIIITPEKPLEFALLWNKGKAVLKDNYNNRIRYMEKGDFIGTPLYLLGEKITDKTLLAESECSFFKIPWDLMLKFYQKNPRILLQLRDIDEFNISS
ncbi:MAG TPA: cyclic nucleotide-binding domain-containing protein [Spirochaetota bacterium]|nr:cyclic nucleotide-binding domain-containing protein [Spirochaetota bacterium]HOL57661.1 cyclic nucleotide-binding domain-containing protein [Spirochaetota bacterium]